MPSQQEKRKTMQHIKKAAAVGLLATLALAGCAGEPTTGDSGAAACAPSEGAVTLEFTSWIPGIEEAADMWNAENPDIQVKVQTGPNGNGGTYQNFFN
jgi:multiple sugar transport system substrate-binding protein